MRTSRKIDFRSSKNNFRGHAISQGLDREPPSLSPHVLALCGCRTHLQIERSSTEPRMGPWCCVLGQDTLVSVPVSTNVYRKIPANSLLWSNSVMDYHPIQGGISNTPTLERIPTCQSLCCMCTTGNLIVKHASSRSSL